MGAWDFSVNHGVAELIIDLKDEKVNKLTPDNMREFQGHLESISEEVKVLLIRSGKPGMFIAGADIAEIDKISTAEDAEKVVEQGQSILNVLEDVPVPTIAVIDGVCLGGGLELALACDYRVVTDHPKVMLGLPEVKLGIIPGFGGTQRMPRVVGLRTSLDLILAGKTVDAKKACRIGLADACFTQAFLDDQLAPFIKNVQTPKHAKSLKKTRGPKGLLETTFLGRMVLFSLAKKALLSKTKGLYPAPLSALRVIQRTCSGSRQKRMHVEALAFAALAPTQLSKNLIKLFYLQESFKKYTGLEERDIKPKDVGSVGVLGAGLMGGGIAWLMTNKSIKVRLKDIEWDFISKAYQACADIYNKRVKRRRMKPYERDLKMQLISSSKDYRGFSDLDLVIEAVPEDMDLKKTIFKELEGVCREDTILATNTSALSVTDMASVLKNPERFVGMHFFSPVHRMPLVEVIRGETTSDQTVATIVELAKRCGKTPVVVKNCPGFLVNRILIPYVNEAIHLLLEGQSVVELDRIVEVFGMPLGPLSLADEVGLDVGYKVSKILEEGYGDRMSVPAIFTEILKEDGLKGKKTGEGFYVHHTKGQSKEKKVSPKMQALINAYVSNNGGVPSASDALDRMILLMVNEAARCLESSVVSSPAHLDMAMIMGCGFPPFLGGLCRYADQRGIPEVVERLTLFSKTVSDRFSPAPLLQRMGESNETFY